MEKTTEEKMKLVINGTLAVAAALVAISLTKVAFRGISMTSITVVKDLS